MNNIIKAYIRNMSMDDVRSFADRKGIILTDDELAYAFSYIKNNGEEMIDKPNSFDLSDHKSVFSNENYEKINKLLKEYIRYLK